EPTQLGVGDHDLAVDDDSLRQVRADRLHDLGEVAGHRPLVPAADLHLVVVAEDDRAEPVPLGLVAERAGRDLLDRLREHGGDGRHNGQTHPPILPHPAPGALRPLGREATLTRSIGAGARDRDAGKLGSGPTTASRTDRMTLRVAFAPSWIGRRRSWWPSAC